MPEELEMTPDTTPEEPETPPEAPRLPIAAAMAQMAGKAEKPAPSKPEGAPEGDKPAGMDQYDAMLEDRPEKFTAVQAGFIRGGGKDSEYHCGDCVHYFTSKAAKRSVCEMVRPADDNENIEKDDTCHFWTKDLEHYPKLEKTDGKQKEGTTKSQPDRD